MAENIMHEADPVKFGLKYIASSPPHEYGGFHPETVKIAQQALKRIEELEAKIRASLEAR